MGAPLADYVKLPGFDEYKEWFKAFADLKREDGILQVTWKTNDKTRWRAILRSSREAWKSSWK